MSLTGVLYMGLSLMWLATAAWLGLSAAGERPWLPGWRGQAAALLALAFGLWNGARAYQWITRPTRLARARRVPPRADAEVTDPQFDFESGAAKPAP